jgi:DNA-directed RNA polymerase subunit RPC12/RpoP
MLIVAIYGVAAFVIVGLGIVLYLFSVQSRRSYHCPSCGERQQVEHMSAYHCNMCGAPFKEDAK